VRPLLRPATQEWTRKELTSHFQKLLGYDICRLFVHLAYLERDGVEPDGAPGRLYGADEEFNAEAFRAPLANEQRQFRFIVSPQRRST